MRTRKNPAKTITIFTLPAAAIAAALALSACGSSGATAATPSLAPRHAAPRAASRDTGRTRRPATHRTRDRSPD